LAGTFLQDYAAKSCEPSKRQIDKERRITWD
jgi:hypothetical protein